MCILKLQVAPGFATLLLHSIEIRAAAKLFSSFYLIHLHWFLILDYSHRPAHNILVEVVCSIRNFILTVVVLPDIILENWKFTVQNKEYSNQQGSHREEFSVAKLVSLLKYCLKLCVCLIKDVCFFKNRPKMLQGPNL